MRGILIGGVVALVAVGLAIGGYLFTTGKLPGKDQARTDESGIIDEVTPEEAKVYDASAPAETAVQGVNVEALIETILSDKSYTNLQPYMAGSVNVTKYATECCGALTPLQASQELKYLSDAAEPWDFSEGNPVAAQLREKGPQYFGEANFIGTSANNYAVGFSILENQIINVVMVADYNLITQP